MENKNLLNKYAMQYGTCMGIFWIIKFAFFPLGFIIPFLEFFFLLLTILVPFVGYYFTRTYRDKCCNGSISFGHAWLFTTFLYMFTALLTSVGHYIYFRFIDNSFIVNSYLEMLKEVNKADMASLGSSFKQLEETVKMIGALSPIQMTMQLLSSNVIYGAILALPTAFFVKKRGYAPMINNQEDNNQEDNNQEDNKE